MLNNTNAIQCQIHQIKYKESKQLEEKLGKIMAKEKSGGRTKKRKKAVSRDAGGFARHLKIAQTLIR